MREQEVDVTPLLGPSSDSDGGGGGRDDPSSPRSPPSPRDGPGDEDRHNPVLIRRDQGAAGAGSSRRGALSAPVASRSERVLGLLPVPCGPMAGHLVLPDVQGQCISSKPTQVQIDVSDGFFEILAVGAGGERAFYKIPMQPLRLTGSKGMLVVNLCSASVGVIDSIIPEHEGVRATLSADIIVRAPAPEDHWRNLSLAELEWEVVAAVGALPQPTVPFASTLVGVRAALRAQATPTPTPPPSATTTALPVAIPVPDAAPLLEGGEAPLAEEAPIPLLDEGPPADVAALPGDAGGDPVSGFSALSPLLDGLSDVSSAAPGVRAPPSSAVFDHILARVDDSAIPALDFPDPWVGALPAVPEPECRRSGRLTLTEPAGYVPMVDRAVAIKKRKLGVVTAASPATSPPPSPPTAIPVLMDMGRACAVPEEDLALLESAPGATARRRGGRAV